MMLVLQPLKRKEVESQNLSCVFPKEDQAVYQSQLKSSQDAFDIAMCEIINMRLKPTVEHLGS